MAIVAPDAGWPRRAHELAAEVRGLLGGWLTSEVVHIGSTAISGLPAKPIVDLMAATKDPAATVVITQHFLASALWFLVQPELDRRPWRRFLVRTDPTDRHRIAHLHLMRTDEPRWHEQLAFRDRLRADPSRASEYARLKIDMVTRFRDDRESYTAAKARFVHRVIADRPGADPGPATS